MDFNKSLPQMRKKEQGGEKGPPNSPVSEAARAAPPPVPGASGVPPAPRCSEHCASEGGGRAGACGT